MNFNALARPMRLALVLIMEGFSALDRGGRRPPRDPGRRPRDPKEPPRDPGRRPRDPKRPPRDPNRPPKEPPRRPRD